MKLFDSHAHYNDEMFDNDREEIIKKTFHNNISNFIVAGYNIQSSKKAIEIVSNYKEAYAIIGISPNDLEDIQKSEDIDNKISEIEQMIISSEYDKTKIVAIGEIGLDYYWKIDNKDFQKKMFIKQIEIANKFSFPIVIHTREAIIDTLDIIKKFPVNKKGIFHCCPLNRELVKEAIKLGYYISLSGVITFKNSKNANEIIEMIPEDRLLIETDSPYLTPEPLRGTRNNCINVKYVAQKIADVKKMQIEDVAKITYLNTLKIFNIN